MTSVLLVSTPFGSLDRPALGLGLLQAQLELAACVREVLRGTWGFDERAVARILRVRATVETFLETCVAAPGAVLTTGPAAAPPTSPSLVGHADGGGGVAPVAVRRLAEPLPLFGAAPSGSR